jgi:phage shock protein C
MEEQIKKFYRTANDQKIAGVCGGIGVYLGVDPLVVRIIFLVLMLGYGSGLLIYLIIWLLSPLK